MKIAIIDDERPAREELKLLLSECAPGATLFTGSSGEEALILLDQEDIDVTGFRRSRGVEDDGSRIGSFLMLDDGSADPFGPDGQLFRRGGPEGIAGSQHDRFPLFFIVFR